MLDTRAFATHGPKESLRPFVFRRRDPGAHDIVIESLYCGICHSDIHQARNEWSGSVYPMVPGHEIAGRVVAVGGKVRRFKVGDPAGVGCFVDSCRRCADCRAGEENCCTGRVSWTYNGVERDGRTRTQGGYSSRIVVDEAYAFKLTRRMPLERVAPLLCAGITTYSPLKAFGVKAGDRVGVVGMGGLGHMAVKLAASMGARVTVFSTSERKRRDALRFGAKEFVVVKDPKALSARAGTLDLVLDTVSAAHDLNAYLATLRRDGTMVIVGVPSEPAKVHAFSLIIGRKRLAGSLIGGTRQTQEMLDYCARKRIGAEVEVIPASRINEAYERTLKGDVRYRFVIDLKTL